MNATTPTARCSEHGLELSTARPHFRWGNARCPTCRTLARKGAYKARCRDPHRIDLVRALHLFFGGRWFSVDHAEDLALRFGLDHGWLEELLEELGPGDYDPETDTGTPGDGIVEIVSGGPFRLFRFDESWVGSRRRESVALRCPVKAVAQTPATLPTPPHPAPTSRPGPRHSQGVREGRRVRRPCNDRPASVTGSAKHISRGELVGRPSGARA